MNYKYIEQLLAKYWECETSLEEEQILRSFFGQADIPEHLSQYAPLFQSQAADQQEELDTDFDKRLLELVDDKPREHGVLRLIVRQTYPFLKAAAVVAVVLTIGNVTERVAYHQGNVQQTGTPDTYIRQEEISAKIKVIDQTRSESIAKADSLQSAPSQDAPIPDEKVR